MGKMRKIKKQEKRWPERRREEQKVITQKGVKVTNSIDVISKVTKFRRTQQGGNAEHDTTDIWFSTARPPHSTNKKLICIVSIS